METELEILLDELERAWDGDPWHGSPLAAILSGMTAAAALTRPIPAAHTIWEITLHLTGWTREVTRRVRGAAADLPAEGDWPAVAEASPAAWEAARSALAAAHHDLLATVRGLPPGRLAEVVGDARDAPLGSGVSFAVTLHGLVQHHAYHAGQIALLRKAV